MMAGSSDEGEADVVTGPHRSPSIDVDVTDYRSRVPKDLSVARLLNESPKLKLRSPSASPTDLSQKRKQDDDIDISGLENKRLKFDLAQFRDFTQNDLPPELELRDGGSGIWASQTVLRGRRFGPFAGKWTQEPVDIRYAWEVRVPSSGVQGFFDGSLEPTNWLKFIRSTSGKDQNLKYYISAGNIYYEATQEIRSGEELLLGPREPLQLDMYVDTCASDDRSERDLDTASPNSVNLEDDREDIEDEENETRCAVCSSVFPDIEQLDEHLVNSHKYPQEHFKCEQCPRAFSWRPGLLRHQTNSHGEIRKYPCENCSKVFTDPSNLQRHIRTHHVGARSHACSECGKTFATSSGLKQHTHIHSSVKPFQCEVCFKSYTQFSNLCRHKRMHADCRLQIKCAKCGQSFSTVTSLTKHRRFCESTTSPISGATATLQTSPTAMNTSPNNPFLLYPRPFYPSTIILPPYSPLFHSPTTHTSPSFPMFLPKPPEDAPSPLSSDFRFRTHHRKRSQEGLQESPFERKLQRTIKDIHITPPPMVLSKTKISPPTAEEAVSLERPSPARPPIGTSTCSYPDPREQLPNDSMTTKTKDFTVTELTEVTETKEQPLDLTVTRKRKIVYYDDDDDRNKMPSPKVASTCVTPLPESPKKAATPVEEVETRTTSPAARLPTSNMQQTMAYPRPIHPMLLDAMYRPSFPSYSPQSERLIPPPPPSPFVSPRSFPFLGSLMNSIPNGQHGQRSSFDLLRSPMQNFNSSKSYQDVLSSHLANGVVSGGKMKDRYGCKYCGKIFPRSANLTRHVRTHTGEQPYKCQYCERSFSISSNLQRHVRNIHNKEKPFKCSLCERCFGQQTNLDRHLKKHETDDGTGTTTVADSPESNENEREDSCFDEIRLFMGKVYNPGVNSNSYPSNLYTPPSLNQDIDVVKDEDDDEDTLSEGNTTSPISPKDYSLPLTCDMKVKTEKESINNNTSEQESIEVAI